MSHEASPEETVCVRCQGRGVLEHFRHVVGGICFRCWGAGVDPQTAKQLEAWLAKAREEYRARKAALGDKKDDRLERELQLIEKLGKENKARLEALQADVEFGKRWARAQSKLDRG